VTRYIKSGTVNTVQEINSELEKIATSQVEFLARNGETPNAMSSDFDMNSKRILNLPPPLSPNEPVRVQDLPDFIAGEGNSLILITREEDVTLTAGQTVVTLTELTTTQTAYYISGQGADQGRLNVGTDFIVTSTTQITLAESYPVGTIVTAVQNSGAGPDPILKSDIQTFDNIAEMKQAFLIVGDTVLCKRYYAGGDLVDGLLFEVQATQAVDSYIDHSLNNGNTAKLITDDFINIKKAGADGTTTNDTPAFYSSLARSGYIDLDTLEINVTVTATTTVTSRVYIKNGKINFSSATLLRVFTWVSGDLFRFENVDIVGNSNGTIDDSFNTTSGTFALIRAELTVDGAASNLELESSKFEGLVICEDNKNAVVTATNFNVKKGIVTGNEFKNVAGHAFAFNCWQGIKIYKNKFTNIGALCADFGAFTKNCTFHDNEIDVASGIAKTQARVNGGSTQIPQNNEITNNTAINLTGGNSSNVAVVKLYGLNDLFSNNFIEYEGTTGADSIEVYGSAHIENNTINRTVNTARSFLTTISDTSILNPVITIANNKGSGMLNFARLQNSANARVTISGNRPTVLSKFVNGEANLLLKGLVISDNEFDCSTTVGVGIQFASNSVNLERLKITGNTIKSEGSCIVAWRAEGACITGNSLEHTAGNNFDIIITNSFVAIGNSGSSAFPATSGQKIVENNTQF